MLHYAGWFPFWGIHLNEDWGFFPPLWISALRLNLVVFHWWHRMWNYHKFCWTAVDFVTLYKQNVWLFNDSQHQIEKLGSRSGKESFKLDINWRQALWRGLCGNCCEFCWMLCPRCCDQSQMQWLVSLGFLTFSPCIRARFDFVWSALWVILGGQTEIRAQLNTDKRDRSEAFVKGWVPGGKR